MLILLQNNDTSYYNSDFQYIADIFLLLQYCNSKL